jgi:cellulose 1,4-beta-cellobiosidase
MSKEQTGAPVPLDRIRRRRGMVAAAAALAIGSGLTVLATIPAHAASGCAVAYSVVNQWNTGFQGSITITNNDAATTSWTLGFAFPSGQTVSQGWDGTWTQSGANVTVTSASWNGVLSTGTPYTIGFTGAYSGTNTNPSTFTLNGVTCNASGGGSSSTTTPPPSTSTTTAPPTTTTAPPTTTSGGGGGTHVADPFAGATPYLNPDYVNEVKAQANSDGSAAEGRVATYQTGIWLDTIAAIAGGGSTGRTGLQAQMNGAVSLAQSSGGPVTIEIVVYDLPGRDCAALASNGEIPATSAGLTEYETQYINPIASILQQYASSNVRVVAIIEPDSLPNVVTNQSKSACSTATPYYETGITYALNALHAISNVYNYLDIAHSAWLGWPSNMSQTPAVYNTVVKGTTAGYASIDGFISDTANYTPVQEPLLTNPTLSIGGQPVDSATFYQYNPTFDELTYDTQMYNTLVSAGFPSSKRFLIDTSRAGWGPTHPTTITSASDVNTYVADNKIDKRPFRGDWCNQNNAGIGYRPADQPFGSSSPILAYVWIKPPGESDGDYPSSTHSHGDPHCDPSSTNTDGNGNTYSTGSIPGYDVPAGQWFTFEFQMLVKNAYPAL